MSSKKTTPKREPLKGQQSLLSFIKVRTASPAVAIGATIPAATAPESSVLTETRKRKLSVDVNSADVLAAPPALKIGRKIEYAKENIAAEVIVLDEESTDKAEENVEDPKEMEWDNGMMSLDDASSSANEKEIIHVKIPISSKKKEKAKKQKKKGRKLSASMKEVELPKDLNVPEESHEDVQQSEENTCKDKDEISKKAPAVEPSDNGETDKVAEDKEATEELLNVNEKSENLIGNSDIGTEIKEPITDIIEDKTEIISKPDGHVIIPEVEVIADIPVTTLNSEETDKAQSPAEKHDQTSDEENTAPETKMLDSTLPDSSNDKSNDSIIIMDGEIQKSDESSTRRSSKRVSVVESTPKSQKMPVRSLSQSAEQKLTPKQLQKKKDAEKRNLERLQAKEERERKISEEKERKRLIEEQRKRERDEKEAEKKREREEKEAERKRERDEKEEQRKREKDEKEKKRLEELNQKNEEKRKKDEQKEEERRKRDDERKKKDDEQKKKELEEESKKKKAAETFAKFFKPKSSDRRVSHDDQNSMEAESQLPAQLNFMPFCVKENMKLAPLTRKNLEVEEKNKLDEILRSDSTTNRQNLYLRKLKNPDYIIGRSIRSSVTNADDDDDDLMIIEDGLGEGADAIEVSHPKQKYRAKFLSFKENRRPPYYGTWRKKSRKITPRRPFESDTVFFDYEIDSDDEWEEEEPGESLKGSDDEDKESEDDYEVDNEFFVPHGYLSDEENKEEDELEQDNRPETQKAKLKIMQQEFAAEMKKKTEKIKPRLIGCIWTDVNGNREEGCHPSIWDLLQTRAIILDQLVVIKKPDANGVTCSPATTEDGENEDNKLKKAKFTDEIISDLIKLIHGNLHSRDFLVKEFLAYLATKETAGTGTFSKSKLSSKIKELSERKRYAEEGPLFNKVCYLVSQDKLAEFGLQDITVPNTWNYTLPPTRLEPHSNKSDPQNAAQSAGKDPECKPTPAINIEKFTKILTDEEKKKNFGDPPPEKNKPPLASSSTAATPNSTGTPSAKPKKRVALLMSVPFGQAIPEKKKNNLISQFLMNGKALPSTPANSKGGSDETGDSENVASKTSSATPMDEEPVIILD